MAEGWFRKSSTSFKTWFEIGFTSIPIRFSFTSFKTFGYFTRPKPCPIRFVPNSTASSWVQKSEEFIATSIVSSVSQTYKVFVGTSSHPISLARMEEKVYIFRVLKKSFSVFNQGSSFESFIDKFGIYKIVVKVTFILLTHQVEAANKIRKVLLQFQQNWQISIEALIVNGSQRCINEFRSDKVGMFPLEDFKYVNVHLSRFHGPVSVSIQIVRLKKSFNESFRARNF